MAKICPREDYKSVHAELSWQIREKELEISRILSKTLFWHEKVDPELAKEVMKKEEFLSSWYEAGKNRQIKAQSLTQMEESLRELKKELHAKKALMDSYYERIGCLALQDYQKTPAKWTAYENIFDPAVKALRSFASQADKGSNPIHFFLASNFSQNGKVSKPLKNICRSVGEKVMQLNLGNFVKKEGENSAFLSEAEYHEREYSKLFKKKRSLEINRNHLYQDLTPQTSWFTCFRNLLFAQNKTEERSPKVIMLELEDFYTKTLEDYLASNPEKIPANMSKALAELDRLKAKKNELEFHITADKTEQKLKSLNSEKLIAQKQLEQLEFRVNQQKNKLLELEVKERELERSLERKTEEDKETPVDFLTEENPIDRMAQD